MRNHFKPLVIEYDVRVSKRMELDEQTTALVMQWMVEHGITDVQRAVRLLIETGELDPLDEIPNYEEEYAWYDIELQHAYLDEDAECEIHVQRNYRFVKESK